MEKKSKLLIYIFLIILPTSISIQEEYYLKIYISDTYINKVGKKGGNVLLSSYTCDYFQLDLDTSLNTIFTNEILYENGSTYNIGCGVWIAYENDIDIFCNINETLPTGKYSIKFSNNTFKYSNYTIKLEGSESFSIIKNNYDIIDIYSDKQSINFTDGKEAYELKFKINSYIQEEELYFGYKLINKADCKKNNNELICTIKRSLLEKQPGPYIAFFSIDKDEKIPQPLYFIPEIDIIYSSEKEDIYVNITKLLTKKVSRSTFIVYETNITDFKNSIIFSNDYLIFERQSEEGKSSCFFKKGEKSPLLLICNLFVEDSKELSLKEIKEERILKTNIYNFRIQPVKINDKIEVIDYPYSPIIGYYPEVLDFTKEDSINIDFFMEYPNNTNGLTFNENEKDLICNNLNYSKRCTVSKKHFKNKKDDYYYLKHTSLNKEKEISYEVGPIKVKLPKSSKKKVLIIIDSVLFSLIIISVIIFIYFNLKGKRSDLNEEVMKTSFKDEDQFI